MHQSIHVRRRAQHFLKLGLLVLAVALVACGAPPSTSTEPAESTATTSQALSQPWRSWLLSNYGLGLFLDAQTAQNGAALRLNNTAPPVSVQWTLTYPQYSPTNRLCLVSNPSLCVAGGVFGSVATLQDVSSPLTTLTIGAHIEYSTLVCGANGCQISSDCLDGSTTPTPGTRLTWGPCVNPSSGPDHAIDWVGLGYEQFYKTADTGNTGLPLYATYFSFLGGRYLTEQQSSSTHGNDVFGTYQPKASQKFLHFNDHGYAAIGPAQLNTYTSGTWFVVSASNGSGTISVSQTIPPNNGCVDINGYHPNGSDWALLHLNPAFGYESFTSAWAFGGCLSSWAHTPNANNGLIVGQNQVQPDVEFTFEPIYCDPIGAGGC